MLAYYEGAVEVDRLDRLPGALEFERTKEIVGRFLAAPAGVADVGGGAGHYSAWLARDGHTVDLVEPVPLHVEIARKRAGDPPRFGVHAGEARALPFGDESFDAVLLLGPLYHLVEPEARLQALREARRVCRPGGSIFAAAISRFAPLLGTVRSGLVADSQVFANDQAETRTGRRVDEGQRTRPFPDAYFHLPEDLAAEVGQAGLDVAAVYGVEGPGWLAQDLESLWADEAVRERLLRIARETEADPHLLGLSQHLLAVARRPA